MNDVRRIESAAHADLEHDRARSPAREIEEPHRGGELKKRRAALAVRRVVERELLFGFADLVDERNELAWRSGSAVDCEPFLKPMQVGRAVKSGSYARRGERRGDHGGRGSLS